ncbi:Putative 12-oxophytodienoate reductase 11 (OPDA-reductase 11) (OsOPR11) [Durusdinium trenchii]|uniref:12-oxophytodienoate reductase 11 (OPDA-reductase 11) (OsOPR11) n=1 Tax=Durusdinium trenchii TaxID=1381693 RepID=A0ABP0LME8_9DINO
MAPMTRSFSPGHAPGPDVAAYYRRRAEGGVGLILTEGVSPNATTATGTLNVPNIVTDEAKAGWREVVGEVHDAGGKIGIQLWHEGPYRNPSKSEHPDIPSWSASGLKVPGKALWAPMSEDEIETAITEFVDAAVAAQEVGFDCVEFHGAHSYLIDSFFWDQTNLRDDQWGGDWSGRTRFACEIIRRSRAKLGPDFPLIIRLSQWKQQDFAAKTAANPDELSAWLTPLVEAGIDIFHCSQRRFWEAGFEELAGDLAPFSDLNFAGWARKLTGKPAISVGSVGLSGEFTAAYAGEVSTPASLDNLISRMERNEFDLIAVGREMGVEYDVKRYDRDKTTSLAPAALKKVHPTGKSPVIEHDGRVIAETGAILEYLVEQHGGALAPSPASADYLRYKYWLHAAEGSYATPLILTLLLNRMETAPMPFFAKPIARRLTAGVRDGYLNQTMKALFDHLHDELGKSEWLAGDNLTAADIAMSFPMEGFSVRGDVSVYPRIKAFLDRIHARAAYQRAVERGGPYALMK